MTELSDYIHCVSDPHAAALEARISALSAALTLSEEARVRADHDLDCRIIEALGFEYSGGANPGWWDAPDPEKPFSGEWRSALLSGSLDAALALVERVLPGWFSGVQQNRRGNPPAVKAWSAYLCPPVEGEFSADADTPALAVCAALLSALLSSEAQPSVCEQGEQGNPVEDEP